MTTVDEQGVFNRVYCGFRDYLMPLGFDVRGRQVNGGVVLEASYKVFVCGLPVSGKTFSWSRSMSYGKAASDLSDLDAAKACVTEFFVEFVRGL